MTWDRKNDRYLLKFRLNLHKKSRGIPSGDDLDEEFLQNRSIPITKRNVLSVACQFYDPTGLAAPLMFSVRSLFSDLCRDSQCSMNSTISEIRAEKFRTAVDQILRTSELSFPRQIVYQGSGQLYIFFDGSLQGYGSSVYIRSQDKVNLLYSTAKVMGKSAFSAPQSEMASAALAVKMQQKISQEMYNTKLSPPTFIGDSEIVLKMIAKNSPADLPIFYGTRVMEISALSTSENWLWCPGPLNPADLLTRSGTTLEQVNSDFWLYGSFLPLDERSWPVKNCASLSSSPLPTTGINRVAPVPVNPLSDLIPKLLNNALSFSKVVNALSIILKAAGNFKQNPNPSLSWYSIRSSISSAIISCFKTDSELFIAKNKLKHLVITPQDGVYYVSDRSFRSRIGVPLICGKTILAKCIVQDAHVTLGHGRDILQTLSYILANFYITGVRKLVTNLKKSCPACLKLVKRSFTAFEADVPDVLKTVQPPFTYAQADIFGPIFAYTGEIQLKRWVLVVFCLSSRAVHLELLHSYSATSISREHLP